MHCCLDIKCSDQISASGLGADTFAGFFFFELSCWSSLVGIYNIGEQGHPWVCGGGGEMLIVLFAVWIIMSTMLHGPCTLLVVVLVAAGNGNKIIHETQTQRGSIKSIIKRIVVKMIYLLERDGTDL